MNQHTPFSYAFIIILLSSFPLLGADETAGDLNAASFKKKTFAALSERVSSRRGDEALALNTVVWEHGESDHFIFHTETGFSASQLASVAEWAYTAIKKDLQITEDSFERKAHIYVFLNPEVWIRFAQQGKLDVRTGGWCTGRELFIHSRPHFKFQGSTLPHEITHLVAHRFLGGDLPLWLNEGLAEFEGIRCYRGYLKARNYQLVGVPDRLERSRYIPLKDLTSALDYPRDAAAISAFYIESHRLVAFLYYECGGMEPLMRFVKQQCAGARFETALREVYGSTGRDIDEFEKKFRFFLTKSKE